MTIVARIFLAALISIASANAHAWFFFFPIPNISKPAPLQKIIDALENSTETRAVAYVSEDKTFGSKYWVWGQYSGYVSQEEANRIALEKCDRGLIAAKAQAAGGQPLYDFGTKRCELYEFSKAAEVAPPKVEPQEETTAAPNSSSKTTGEQVSPTANKLKELEALLKQGLITEEEYKPKRKAILDSM